MRGGICCAAACAAGSARSMTGTAAVTYGRATARVATAAESATVASAESAACMTASSSATAVLREGRMRSEGEHCGERQRGEEVRGARECLEAVATVSRVVANEWWRDG